MYNKVNKMDKMNKYENDILLFNKKIRINEKFLSKYFRVLKLQ